MLLNIKLLMDLTKTWNVIKETVDLEQLIFNLINDCWSKASSGHWRFHFCEIFASNSSLERWTRNRSNCRFIDSNNNFIIIDHHQLNSLELICQESWASHSAIEHEIHNWMIANIYITIWRLWWLNLNQLNLRLLSDSTPNHSSIKNLAQFNSCGLS